MDNQLRRRIDRAANASLFFYAVTAVSLPICLVQITREMGFSLTQAGAFGFISSLEQLAVLILSGFIAARFGKLRILRAALLILAAGFLMFTRISSYPMAVSIILVIGIGSGFLEALLAPLVENLYPEDNGSKQNLLQSFWPIGVLVSTLIIGEILSRGISWRWVFAGIAILVASVTLLYPSPKSVTLPRARSDFSHMGEILRHPKFWVLGFALFFAGGAEGGFTYWLASYIQLHLDQLPRAGGIGTAAFALGMFAGRRFTSLLANRMKLKTILTLSALLAIFTGLGFFLVSSLGGVYFSVFLAGLTIACFWPSLQTYAARAIPVDPTLLMILMSCLGLLGFSSATLIMGALGDLGGLRNSFLVVPSYLFILLLLVLLENRIPLFKTASPEGGRV
jgi:fucose permease